jgi:hypothetical protein
LYQRNYNNRNTNENGVTVPRTNNLATIMAANPTLSRADSELLLANHNDLNTSADEIKMNISSSSNNNTTTSTTTSSTAPVTPDK